MKAKLENLFSVPVVFSDVEDSIIKNSLILAESYIEKNIDLSKHQGKTITTYHAKAGRNYLGKVNDFQLINSIGIVAKEFNLLLGLKNQENFAIESWLNINPSLTGHTIHEHYGSIISGVIYLKAAENSGDLVFHDPIKTRVQNYANLKIDFDYEDNEYNNPVMSSIPIPGKLVLFESWVAHSVEPNLSDELRISIAFNITYNNKFSAIRI
jgi:uncharacterized protein (TIGR02466 family)